MSLHGVLCSEQQKASVPTGIAEAAHEFHGMVLRQDPHDLAGHIASDGEGAEMIKMMESQLSEAPCSCPVTFPGLWLHQEVLAE